MFLIYELTILYHNKKRRSYKVLYSLFLVEGTTEFFSGSKSRNRLNTCIHFVDDFFPDVQNFQGGHLGATFSVLIERFLLSPKSSFLVSLVVMLILSQQRP